MHPGQGSEPQEQGRTWDGGKVVYVFVGLLALLIVVALVLRAMSGDHDMDDMGAPTSSLSGGASLSNPTPVAMSPATTAVPVHSSALQATPGPTASQISKYASQSTVVATPTATAGWARWTIPSAVTPLSTTGAASNVSRATRSVTPSVPGPGTTRPHRCRVAVNVAIAGHRTTNGRPFGVVRVTTLGGDVLVELSSGAG